MEALGKVTLTADDLAVVQLAGKAEQLQVQRARAALHIVTSNPTLRAIDSALATVLDKRVTGSLAVALSDVSSFLHAVAIILSLKGSTAGGRAVAAVDAFTNVEPMKVVPSDSFNNIAAAAIARAEARVQELEGHNMTLETLSMLKEIRVFPQPGVGVDTSLVTKFKSAVQGFIDDGSKSFAPLKASLQKLLTSNASQAGSPGYFAVPAPASMSALGVGVGDTAAAPSSPKKAPFRTAAGHAASLKAGSPSAPQGGDAQRGRGGVQQPGRSASRADSRSRDRGQQGPGGRLTGRSPSPSHGRNQSARGTGGGLQQQCDLGATCPYLCGESGCKKRHTAAEHAAADAARRDNGSRDSRDGRPWAPRRGPDVNGERTTYRNYSLGLSQQTDAAAASVVRPNVSFQAALTADMPAKSAQGRDLASRFASPARLAPAVLKPVPVPQQVNRAAQWDRLRRSILADASRQTASSKTRTLRKHGKTIQAMVFEMDMLYEKLAVAASAGPEPAPQRGYTQEQLKAFMADGMAGVKKIVIDTGAQAHLVPESAPLADTRAANALITGASSATPAASKTTGNLTVLAGTEAEPVHLQIEGAHVVKSLPPNLVLASYGKLRNQGWRLYDKVGSNETFLLSPPTTDGKRRRLWCTLEQNILVVKDVMGVAAGLLEAPSWLENSHVYTLVTGGSAAPAASATENLRQADPPSIYINAFMVAHDELLADLPDGGREEVEPAGPPPRQRKLQKPQVWRNDRCAADSQPSPSKSQAKRAAKKAKVAAQQAAAASASVVDLVVPDELPIVAEPTAAAPAAPLLPAPAPIPPLPDVIPLPNVDVEHPWPARAAADPWTGLRLVVDTGAASHFLQSMPFAASQERSHRRVSRAPRLPPTTTEQGVAAPVVDFIESAGIAAAAAIRQVATPVVDFIDFTCAAAVEAYRKTLPLRGPDQSAGWRRFRAALNRGRAPVPVSTSVTAPAEQQTAPAEQQLPAATVVPESLAVKALLKLLLRCSTVQVPAASLACLAAANTVFRAALYSGPETDVHSTLNPWCRTPEYIAAAACAPCLHPGCNCRLRFQPLTPEASQRWFQMFKPVHTIAQRLYDQRYGHHNGQFIDSPGDRAAVVRALRGSFPDITVHHDSAGRLSLEWDQHLRILNVASAVKSALTAARRQAAWARLDIGATARELPVLAACYRCRETTAYDLVKCSRAGCATWVHTSCQVPSCPHYLTQTDCGTTVYRPTRWQCHDCTLSDRENGTYVSDDEPPGLVDTSDDDSASDSEYVPLDDAANLNGRRFNPFIRRRHRQLPEACCPEDERDPFNRSNYFQRNPCLTGACAADVHFFGSQLQPPRPRPRSRRDLAAPIPEPDLLEAAQAWCDSMVWYHDGEDLGSTSTRAFIHRHAAGRQELEAWAAEDAALPLAVPEQPVELVANMAIIAEETSGSRGRGNRHRRQRGRPSTDPTGQRSRSRSPEPQRFPRPPPAAPRRRGGRPLVTLTYPDGIFDRQLRNYTSVVAHQVNTAEIRPGGLAAAVADFAPYADVFRGRQAGPNGLVPPDDRATPGSVRVDRPPVTFATGQLTFVAMYAQIFGGGPGHGADDAAHRENYFGHCLDAINPAMPRLESIAFPKFVGCTIAGGDWDRYERMIRHFAGLHPHLQVYLVERGPIARVNGQPIAPVHHHRVPQSPSSASAPTSSGTHRHRGPVPSSQHRAHGRPGTAAASHVTSSSVEALDVIASQRAADDADALAAAAARPVSAPTPAPALASLTRIDQLPGVLGVHVGEPTAAGVTFLRRHCLAGPKVVIDWGCGSGSSIEAALEVPGMLAVGFDIFDPSDQRVVDMLSRWNPRGRPRRAAYVQCLKNRVPTVRDLRSILHHEFGLPLTALCIMSGSPECATMSSAPSSHEFLARGGPPDFAPQSPRARADDAARIQFMDLLEELHELIPREDPLASFTGMAENPLYGCFRQVRDVRERLQFSRRGYWTEHSADHCIAAAVPWPMKSSCYVIIGDCHHFSLRCRPGQRCKWSTGDPSSHRHSLTIVDYNDNAPGQSRVPDNDIRRSAIPLRTYHTIYALILKAQMASIARVLDERRSSTSSARTGARPGNSAEQAARDVLMKSCPSTPSTQPSTSSANRPVDTSQFVRQALVAGVSAASAAVREHPRDYPIPDREHTAVVLDDNMARQFRQHAVLMLDPAHPLYHQCVTVQEPSHVASVVQQSWQTYATGKIGLLRNPHPTAYGLHCAMLHTRPEVLLHCVRQWAGFSMTGADGKLIPADQIRLADLQFEGPCDSCMNALTTAPAVRHTRHQLTQSRLAPRVHQLSAPSPRVQTRGSIA